nr:hypothetical protein HK105_000081 [Polyrhizophydium stewartii]
MLSDTSMLPPASRDGRRCVVLGAGVVGLTTALLLQRNGWRVTVVAAATPEAYDEADPAYASPKAGADWTSFAAEDDLRLKEFEVESFKVLEALSRHPAGIVGLMPSRTLMPRQPAGWKRPWFAEHVPGFRTLAPAEIPAPYTFGYEHTTVSVNVPRYLAHLLAAFRDNGGELDAPRKVAHIDDLIAAFPGVDVFVVCAGLGARTLGGVADETVVPVRGQIAVIKADVAYAACVVESESENVFAMEELTYIIPRNDGTCIIGGTCIRGDSDMAVRPETFGRIVERATALHEDISAWASLHGASEAGIEAGVVRHAVGLRPVRRDGIRIDASAYDAPTRRVVLAHHYGHGGYGFQTSWGSAMAAVKAIESASLQFEVACAPETRHLLKSLMRTSKLTYSQQRFLDGLVSAFGRHERAVARAAELYEWMSRPGIRTLDQIKQAGMYEPDVFRTTPMKDMQAEKERFQDRLEGIERPKDSLKAFGRRRGLRSKEVDAMPAIAEEPAVDEFEMVQQEIQERRQWLDDMIALGRGDKYKRQIQGEIAQRRAAGLEA